MSEIAYIFPGQGAQYVGMGKELYDKFSVAKSLFKKADEILGFSLSKLIFDGPANQLTHTANCQPAILVVSIAALEAFKLRVMSKAVPILPAGRQDLRNPKFAAGLSLGEYSALVAAGSLSFEDALRLVRLRGELMHKTTQTNPGGAMASVLGLSLQAVKNICNQTDVEIANINCPGQIVVSGARNNLEALKSYATDSGAKKIIFLDVSGAFHSKFMKEAAVEFKETLEKVNIRDCQIPVVSNVDAKPHTKSNEIRENLEKQLYSSVLWQDCIYFMIAQGVNKFLEIGPGKVLKGLLRRIDPAKRVINLEKEQDFNNV